ncbi:MAG TPA: 1,2-phenylacetyl-CoA epoxidase subunit PaaD [Actinopolymorphaceae bacterium]|jgi:ring-1,2-phenylacetyl-CoA epoxidase subunit PaaD
MVTPHAGKQAPHAGKRVDREEAYAVVAKVRDPELPMLTIADLGILRDVRVRDDRVEVAITPTYSGCPALEAIRTDVVQALHTAGFTDVHVDTVLTPAWSTDWISAEGRRTLAAHGVAPPEPRTRGRASGVDVPLSVRCPQCGSLSTREVSRFGPAPCLALRQCESCREPFEQMKTL